MTRAAWLGALAGLTFAACAGAPPAVPQPDWRGPAVHCRHLGDRGLAVELVAPTAGHRFELGEVKCSGERADVYCTYLAPTADLVAQVVTTHRLEIPAARLGDAHAVWIWVATGDGAPRLAIATARP